MCIDVLSMVYNMTQTVLLYVAFEAGTKMQKGFCIIKLPCVLHKTKSRKHRGILEVQKTGKSQQKREKLGSVKKKSHMTM